MIKFELLEFWNNCLKLLKRIKNAACRFRISALVLEIFEFEKYVKYTNESADDIIINSNRKFPWQATLSSLC